MSHLKKRKREPSDKPDGTEPVTKKAKVDVRSRNWFLTWNNYVDGSIGILLKLTGAKRWCIQEEVGKDGTKHLQGVMVFTTNVLFSTLNNACDKLCWWSKCRNVQAAKNYCSKVPTASGKRWVKGFHILQVAVVDPLEGKKLYDWQQEILDMVRGEPDDRKVYWYWSALGNVGKSVLCKHMALKEDAVIVGGAFRDAYYAIMQRVQKKLDVHLVVFSLTRSQGSKVSYTAIEGIKDGMFFSPKYESGMCLYNAPHVLVFANEEPDLSQLSKDRWVVKCLDVQVDLPYFQGDYNFSINKT